MSTKRVKAQLFTRLDKVEDMWGLPATAEAYERMVEQMARSLCYPTALLWPHLGEPQRNEQRNKARAALRAIGITPPKKGQP